MLVFDYLDENHYQLVAGVTGLEPATSGVTGQRSDQLNYDPVTEGSFFHWEWWALQGSNL